MRCFLLDCLLSFSSSPAFPCACRRLPRPASFSSLPRSLQVVNSHGLSYNISTGVPGSGTVVGTVPVGAPLSPGAVASDEVTAERAQQSGAAQEASKTSTAGSNQLEQASNKTQGPVQYAQYRASVRSFYHSAAQSPLPTDSLLHLFTCVQACLTSSSPPVSRVLCAV